MTEGVDHDGGTDEPAERGRPRVLVAEDEPDVRALYVDRLADEYDVVTAADGEEALAVFDDTVDVVLLDRRLPGLHGDDTLDRIRESGVDVRVAAVTALGADLDLVGLPVDAYLEKPVDAAELRETVDRLVRIARYDDRVRRYYAATEKLAALDGAPGVSTSGRAYRELVRRHATLERGIDDVRARLDDDDYEILFRDLAGDDGSHGDPHDLYA
ncbi:response regulator [Halobaculum lipolyticum]|uniref:Response regulator n=1 Tax=Halobaculum lipolyticum TaxID=3032001 RepID=A0ABD5WDT7_9EURY|nr:response regulator [Halobaculum sp. DT31]